MLASLLTHLRDFGPVPAADQKQLLTAWEPRAVRADEVLIRAGQVAHEVFFVQQGIVRVVSPRPDGKEVTHVFLQAGRFCTLLHSFIHQVPALESLQAACTTQLLVISKKRLDELYWQLPYFAELMQRIIQQELLDKMRQRNSYLGLDAHTRYQQFLQQQPDVAKRVSLTVIASYLGITPQSLSRLRKING